jgi:uncharacterized surface protein with fasciclin (FAS1) repeats
MKTNRSTTARIGMGLGIALAAAAFTAATPASPAGAAPATIADVVLSDSAKDNAQGFDRNWHDYDIVTQAVLLFPDLVAAVSDPNASLTVLAPNDQAFRRLASDLTKKHFRTEADVFAAVAGLGTDTVKNVLLYHIIPAKLGPADVLASNKVQVATLLDGASITVRVRNPKVTFVQFTDNDPNSPNPSLNRISVGGVLANGYIHGIDRVLRPIDL